MDERDDALKSLQLARSIAPENAEALSLEGFMLLAAGKTDPAVAAFKTAIQRDSMLGEPHLGLALCHMRRGEPEPAMAEMSAAVLLEPRRSLFVSYWAKMLYELKRFDEALDMLAFAKDLDPRDPTPFLYEGIIHLCSIRIPGAVRLGPEQNPARHQTRLYQFRRAFILRKCAS
ncbi:MAG: hypothetical protein COX19_13570 [Desulfobacterales bacterium CG23_combo_of_CG06-09_8_20_14_all_51_8]|nr:MAG: hypothetical protein COX19_13570 [Desulfobacterales bacterium CG23_combo_of_CG06-09_8_20_14_all_51_8]